ncbi:MAG: protein kinase [Pseudonocardiaceae bacterium]|nr:protein kinase [Pseudonocardiaceae bacterium]
MPPHCAFRAPTGTVVAERTVAGSPSPSTRTMVPPEMSMRPSDETRIDHDAPAPVSDAPVVLDDRYELGPAVGHGGTATVYRAHDRTLERTVAVKLFAPGAVGPDQRRHDYEIRTLAHLNHPGLVALYDAGSHEGRAYLVMQLVEGHTLADAIDPEDRLSAETTTALGAVLAASLGYVHGRGVVHRDLKPANVLLDTEGHPMITDFGIARLVDTTRVTTTGFMVGTAAYLAPEQVRGQHISSATDVYALGLVLLECITGRREYPGGALEAAVARLHRPPLIPDELPEPLATLLRRMTADDPAQRPSAVSIAGALADGEHGTAVVTAGAATPTEAIAPLAAGHATDSDEGPLPAPWPRSTPPPGPPTAAAGAAQVRRRRRLAVLTAGGACTAVAAVVLAVLALGGPDQAPSDPPAQQAPAPVSPVEPTLTEQRDEVPTEPTNTVAEEPPRSPEGGQPPPGPLPGVAPPPLTSEQPPETTTEPTSPEAEQTTSSPTEPEPEREPEPDEQDDGPLS